MTNQWLFKSETYDNCNCDANCGCQFNLPTTHGFCQSAYTGTIIEGHFNDTPLVGLNWAAFYKWPGEIAAGNGQRQIVIDERADEAQRTALETIVSGEACTPLSNFFSVFASTCSEFCETLFLPIELEANFELRTARVDIPGVMKSSGKPIINEFNGQPFHIAYSKKSALTVSLPKSGANFYVEAKTNEQLIDALLIILSYGTPAAKKPAAK